MPALDLILSANNWLETLSAAMHISFDIFGFFCICMQLIDKNKLAAISGILALVAAIICSICNLCQYVTF